MGSCVMHGLFAAVVLAVWMAAGEAVTPPRKYVVNLDLPPTKRWQEVALDHKQIVPDVHKVLLEYVPEELVPYIDLIATDLDAYIDQPYADEMRGIANVLNVSLGEILLINVIYDLTAYCTSIVSQDQAGMIWHSRNLDYSFTDMLKNITIQVDYQRGGQTAYSSITYAGYVGILMGQRPNVFTVTVDERDQGIPLWNLIVALFDSDVVPVSFLVRDALDADKTFENAVSRFAYTPTAADAYFILAGVNKDEGMWYLVETNYDHWKPPPQADDRRDPAIKAMNAMGRPNISVQNLFNVMSTPPVLNKGTTYTVVMSAAKPSLMQAWIRD